MDIDKYSWSIFGGTQKLYKCIDRYTNVLVDGKEQYWNYQLLNCLTHRRLIFSNLIVDNLF